MVEIQPSFEVVTSQRLIRFGAEPLSLDAVEFEVLSQLIERPGHPLSSGELLALLAHLDVHDPAALWAAVVRINRTLAACAVDAGYVLHTPESGYALIVPPLQGGARALGWTQRHPASVVGRAESIELLSWQLSSRRFVTVVGPGGIGKTTLAQATAQARREAYADGVHFVDLAPLADERLVPDALAAALGLPMSHGAVDPLAYLRGRQLLIVLDSCEHVLQAVAALVESFLSDAPQVHVLATSREPLRALGEWLHRLEPMRLPARADALTAVEAASYPGIQLFVERARSGPGGFELTDELAPAVAELCIKLDGMPLALELAAARVPLLGVHGLLSQIEDRLLVLLDGSGRRRPHRHRTLEALLDWSHELLSPAQQTALHRLAVFRGNFSLAVAATVIGSGDGVDDPVEQTELILDLAAKSLISRVATGGAPVLRLLDTTRAYAAAKLALDPDRSGVHRRHARAMRALLIEAEADWERLNRDEWRARYAAWTNDVRAALDWAFGTPGEQQLAVQLIDLALALAEQTSLLTGYSEWANRALEALPGLQDVDPLLEIRLHLLPVMHQQRDPLDETTTIARVKQVLELAQAHGEPVGYAGPLLALWGFSFQQGDYPAASHWSRYMGDIGRTAGDPFLQLISKRTGAQASHYLGDHRLADTMAREVLASTQRRVPLAYFPSPVDAQVSMRIVRVRVLWLQGRPREAMDLAQVCMEIARADTLAALCHTLAMAAVPLALWCGDVQRAAALNQQLRELVTSYSFGYWRSWWEAYEAILAAWTHAGAEPTQGRVTLTDTSDKLREQLISIDVRWLCVETVARVEAGTVGWCGPEVLRAQGEAARAAAPQQAEALFERALQMAREQGATAWELRAALSLSDLWQSQGSIAQARRLLGGVRERFTDDFVTADLAAADSRLLAWAAQP